MRAETPSLVVNNRRFHGLITDGVDVEYRRPDGSIAGDKVWLFDFDHPERNDWLAHVWGDTWYCLRDKDLRQVLVVGATSWEASS
jgi:Type I restriction enzyme R protein N terminus (HSDR_N)